MFKGKEQKQEKNRGITLIALVITIIVMLILVTTTITMAINGGLFENAWRAVNEMQNAIDFEQQLADGKIYANGVWYNSIDEYLQGEDEEDTPTVVLPEGWEETEKPAKWDSDKVTAITDGENIVPLPNGYEIIEGVEGETSVEKGLVIKDGKGNEFVWIPVTEDLEASYSSSSSYSEPTALTDTDSSYGGYVYDSQDMLNHLYETKEDGETPYYNYAEDFNYADEYADMVANVNKYDGFYIGRYETTIDDEGNIGSKYNTTVLIASRFLKVGTNPNTSEPYYYRWYGLYYATKNANVEGNGEYVQTAMIYGALYDKTMDYIRTQKAAGNTIYDVDTATSAWHNGSSVVNSGQTNAGDVALNIWDLESNAFEWTQETAR